MYAGTGNETMLKACDLMQYLGSQDEVKVISMYIEGIEDGRKFGEVARTVTRVKPVVALKAGRSESGSRAAQSHTGSMTGSFATYSAMFRQSGVIQVMTPTDLINVSAAAAHLPIPRSNRVGIMTMGGGWGIIAADECEDSGLQLPPLPESVIRELDACLPKYWNRRNPVDVVGENDAALYLKVIETLARWEEIDSVIALGIVGRSRYVEDFIAAQVRLDSKLYSRELKLTVLKDQVQTEERILSGVHRFRRRRTSYCRRGAQRRRPQAGRHLERPGGLPFDAGRGGIHSRTPVVVREVSERLSVRIACRRKALPHPLYLSQGCGFKTAVRP